MKIKESDIIRAVMGGPLIILLIVCFFLTQSFLGTNNYSVLNKVFQFIIPVFCAIIFSLNMGKVKLLRRDIYLYFMLLLPNVVIFIYTIILTLTTETMKFSQIFVANKIELMTPLVGILIYYVFGEKVIDFITIAAVLNYSVYILAFVMINGIGGFLHFVELTDSAPRGMRPLEVHEITFIFGILVIYYLFNLNKGKYIYLIICVVFCLLGYKRILLTALICAVIMWFVLKDSIDQENGVFLRLASYTVFSFCLLWVYVTATGLFEVLARKLDIELNGRDRIVAVLKNFYTLSIFYPGRGSGFVRSIMQGEAVQRVLTVNSFHNDILKYYIDLGCIPSTIFFLNTSVWNTRRVQRWFSYREALAYLTLTMTTVIGWATDNLASYPNYLMVNTIITLALLGSTHYDLEGAVKGNE